MLYICDWTAAPRMASCLGNTVSCIKKNTHKYVHHQVDNVIKGNTEHVNEFYLFYKIDPSHVYLIFASILKRQHKAQHKPALDACDIPPPLWIEAITPKPKDNLKVTVTQQIELLSLAELP